MYSYIAWNANWIVDAIKFEPCDVEEGKKYHTVDVLLLLLLLL